MLTTGLTKDDSSTLGFVLASLFSGAICLAELREWATRTLLEFEPGTEPAYLVDLVDFADSLPSVYRVIGFTPWWPRSADEELALVGLAVERGGCSNAELGGATQELAALSRNPQILARFAEVFPFVAIRESG